VAAGPVFDGAEDADADADDVCGKKMFETRTIDDSKIDLTGSGILLSFFRSSRAALFIDDSSKI